MKILGLLGYPLEHSFSKKLFDEKFKKMGRDDLEYRLFPLKKISEITGLIEKYPDLEGLNVTIPYKEAVIPFLNEIDEEAKDIGAVNTIIISRKNGEPYITGKNTDHYGFTKTLDPFIGSVHNKALVLGSGGSSKAVQYALKKMNIKYTIVSRSPTGSDQLSYMDINADVIKDHLLIINTTPVGMYPHVYQCLPIPSFYIGSQHLVIDLIYNPEETVLLCKAKRQGAVTLNGLKMLEFQAEKSWGYWEK